MWSTFSRDLQAEKYELMLYGNFCIFIAPRVDFVLFFRSKLYMKIKNFISDNESKAIGKVKYIYFTLRGAIDGKITSEILVRDRDPDKIDNHLRYQTIYKKYEQVSRIVQNLKNCYF